MARFRNPRYAPESLERRLNPSDFVGLLPAAQVAPGPAAPAPLPLPYPPLDPSLPPSGDPLPPIGPSLPA